MFDAYTRAEGLVEIDGWGEPLHVTWTGEDLTLHSLEYEEVLQILEWLRAGPSAERVASTLGKIRQRGPDAVPPQGVVDLESQETPQGGTMLFADTERPDPKDETCPTSLPRTPGGTINNCAIANGDDEANCQMCPQDCPDKSKGAEEAAQENSAASTEGALPTPAEPEPINIVQPTTKPQGMDPSLVMQAYAKQEEETKRKAQEELGSMEGAQQAMIQMLSPKGAPVPEVSQQAKDALAAQIERLQQQANAINQQQRAVIPVVGEQYQGEVVQNVAYAGQEATLTLASGTKVRVDMRTGQEIARTTGTAPAAKPSAVELGVTTATTQLLDHFVVNVGCDEQQTIAALEELKQQEHMAVKGVKDIPAVVRQYMGSR